MSGREYRSTTLSMMMQVPEYALDVYNAINGSNWTDPNLVEVILLENSFSLSVRNDSSFIINTELNFFEHQSTYNPNMPLRSIIYFANMLKRLYKKYDWDFYSSPLISLPTPKFVVLYNGNTKRPEVEIQRLSDHFEKQDLEPQIELIVTVYNINPGFNENLRKTSKVITGYCTFVEKVKALRETMELEEALDCSFDYCINNDIMSDFFREKRGDIKEMIQFDYSAERRAELAAKDGFKRGEESATITHITNLMNNTKCSLEEACNSLGIQLTDNLRDAIVM